MTAGFLIGMILCLSGAANATDAMPTNAVKTVPAQAAKASPTNIPNIALLLPLKSADFGAAAEAVRDGFMAAASSQPHALPVQVYECADDCTDITALYQQAVAGGARAVAGPLTRNSVALLANYTGVTVPTLALSVSEGRGSDKLYYFGRTAESEGRQIAQLAASAGLKSAGIVSSGTPLSRRLTKAFAEEWKILGNNISKEIVYQNDPAELADLPAAEGNMVFLAADADLAHLIHPYLNPALPVYATSQVFNGNTDTLTNFDLNEIHFIDMPWLLQPDHPAVMIYPRANPPLSIDMERLYALGIDAFRLLQIMLDNSFNTSFPLDGVTGRIRLNAHQEFQREAIPAVFWQGHGLTPEDKAAQEAALVAAKAEAASGVPPSPPPQQ
jgi:outer membrane PBP1 activator LpoA protein